MWEVRKDKIGLLFSLASISDDIQRALRVSFDRPHPRRDPDNENCPYRPKGCSVNISDAGPFGQYLHWLINEPRRGLGFFIQMLGFDNAFPCEACDIKMRNAGSKGTAGMAPFFGCKSMIGGIKVPGQKEAANYACGNCMTSISGAQCSFQRSGLAFARAGGDFPIRNDLANASGSMDILRRVVPDALVPLAELVKKGQEKAAARKWARQQFPHAGGVVGHYEDTEEN